MFDQFLFFSLQNPSGEEWTRDYSKHFTWIVEYHSNNSQNKTACGGKEQTKVTSDRRVFVSIYYFILLSIFIMSAMILIINNSSSYGPTRSRELIYGENKKQGRNRQWRDSTKETINSQYSRHWIVPVRSHQLLPRIYHMSHIHDARTPWQQPAAGTGRER